MLSRRESGTAFSSHFVTKRVESMIVIDIACVLNIAREFKVVVVKSDDGTRAYDLYQISIALGQIVFGSEMPHNVR